MFKIPNIITLLNLLCGVIGIWLCGDLFIQPCIFLILLAAVFDFFDGFAARMLKQTSPIGKDLDSLADMVTFGVLPGFMFFRVYSFDFGENIYSYACFLIPLFSALRLAKFNNDERQSTLFYGLPTPANAFFIASICWIILMEDMDLGFLRSIWFIPTLSVVLSILLISDIPLMSLKFKSFDLAKNWHKYLLLSVSLVLLLVFKMVAIPLIIVFYLVLSIILRKKITHEI